MARPPADPEVQARFAELVGCGCTQHEAARAVGVSERTGERWLTDPGVRAHVEETKVRLSNKTDDLQLLDEMLQDKDPKVRMAAPVLKQKLKAAQRQRSAGLDQTGGSVTVDTQSGSIREILEARIRDPKVSARDLASLTNALIKLDEDLATARDSMEQTLVFPFEGDPAMRVVRVYVLPTDDTILSRDEWPAAEAPPEEELLQPPSGYELAPPPKRNLDGSIAGSKPEPEPEEDDDLEDRERPIPG